MSAGRDAMARKNSIVPADTTGPLGFTDPPDLLIECDAFRGTLAALFTCAREGKVDLMGIPLAPICESYFVYVMESEGGDIEASATAMAALAYLLERKAWQLVPRPEEPEPEAPDDLNERTEPWIQEFKPAIEALEDLHRDRSLVFFRAPDSETPYELPFEAGEVTASDLARALSRLLTKALPDPPDHLSRPRRSLADQMTHVMRHLKSEFLPLEELLGDSWTRSEVVWWFLALLELIRLGQAKVALREGEAVFASGSLDQGHFDVRGGDD